MVKNAARLAGPLQRIRREAYPGVRLQTSLKEKQRIILLSALKVIADPASIVLPHHEKEIFAIKLRSSKGGSNLSALEGALLCSVSSWTYGKEIPIETLLATGVRQDSHQSQLLVIDAYPRSSSPKVSAKCEMASNSAHISGCRCARCKSAAPTISWFKGAPHHSLTRDATGEAPYCEAKNDGRKWCQKEDRSHGLVSTANTAHQGRRKKNNAAKLSRLF